MPSDITVVTPVSPILSHPETHILEQTLDSVRHHLPDAELIVTFDGVRPEQESRRADYEEFIRRALWLLDKKYGNAYPFVFDQHMHQVGMLRHVLDEVPTPLLMYVEADTPLVVDEDIQFELIAAFINSGESNLVRLHHEGVIPAEHEHMMHGSVVFGRSEPFPVGQSSAFMRTGQWSQRPHVASVAYYRRCLGSYFSPDAKSFIEDKMHGIVDEAFKVDGMAGWSQHRLHLYDPGNGNMKRSLHLDGRAGEPKLDDTQVF